MKNLAALVFSAAAFFINIFSDMWMKQSENAKHLFIYLFIYYFPTIKITQALHYTKMWRGDLRKPQGLYEEAPSLQ